MINKNIGDRLLLMEFFLLIFLQSISLKWNLHRFESRAVLLSFCIYVTIYLFVMDKIKYIEIRVLKHITLRVQRITLRVHFAH